MMVKVFLRELNKFFPQYSVVSHHFLVPKFLNIFTIDNLNYKISVFIF